MEIALLIAIISVLVLLVFFIKKAQKKYLNDTAQRELQQLWKKIQQEPDIRQQILHADSLLDKAMNHLGYQEKHLGNKLKAHPKTFTDLNDVWWAHKLRNRIAHEITFYPTSQEHSRAMHIFRRALRELGVSV